MTTPSTLTVSQLAETLGRAMHDRNVPLVIACVRCLPNWRTLTESQLLVCDAINERELRSCKTCDGTGAVACDRSFDACPDCQ